MSVVKVAVMQPYFFPYIGYFQLLHAVDVFVVFDDVNYIKKGWINRNVINLNGGQFTFTVPLEDSSQNKKINEILIKNDPQWWSKFHRTLSQSFSKTPFFNESNDLFTRVVNYPGKNLAEFVGNSLIEISGFLDISPKIIYSSSLKISSEFSGENRIIEICKQLKAETYINPINGETIYSRSNFNNAGIELAFIKLNKDAFANSFDPFMSTLEVFMKFGKEQYKSKLAEYRLE